jgi:hypothetical protein
MVSDILPDIVHDIFQAGLLPPLDKEAAGIITGSEAIFKEFASKHSLNELECKYNQLFKQRRTKKSGFQCG